jgi:hypothetical protein
MSEPDRDPAPASDDDEGGAIDPVVVDFWQWFTGVAPQLAKPQPPEGLIDELTVRVQEDLGVPGWEIGPDPAGAPRMFALSPEGDPELLAVTGAVVDAAPALPGWAFYAARPARPGAPLRFTMGDVDVDASGWRFVCLAAPEGGEDETGIVVEQPGLEKRLKREDDRLAAAVICLDGLIGEGRRLETFSEVYAVPRMRPEEAALARPIAELPAALDEDPDDATSDET